MSNVPMVPTQETMNSVDLRAQVNLIQQVMKEVMQEGVHYGEIPGMKAKSGEAKKYVLFKPGSEKIMLTFRIANDLLVEDLSNNDEYRYRVRSRAVHIATGQVLGEGIGEASTSEEKYKWKAAICDQEFEETAEDRRRKLWKKGWDGKPAYTTNQVRTNPSDLANTVLKMAKKRAQIDMVLTVTAASDIFTQDLEDEEAPQQAKSKEEVKEPTESLTCSSCMVAINAAVKDFSTKKFGKALCMGCQKEAANAN